MALSPQDYRKTLQTHRRGTRALQPLATDVLEGTLYFVTNENITERSNGTIWELYSSPSQITGVTGYPYIIDGEDGEGGLPGAQGIQGKQGIQGFQGIPGFDGEDGLDGMPGIQGIQGLQGAAGSAGSQGIQGLIGPPGMDGENAEDGYYLLGSGSSSSSSSAGVSMARIMQRAVLGI